MFTTISGKDIETMAKLYRLNLINSITGYKSANLIGTQNKEGKTNLAVFSSVTHLGSNPPVVGMVLRPTTVPRHTFDNIMNTGFYSINHIKADFVAKAHQTSAKYGLEASEFTTCGFNTYYSDNLPVPYVRESLVKIGVQFKEKHQIKVNGTLLIVGEIIELIIPENAIAIDGFVNLAALRSVAINGLDMYGRVSPIDRLSYARVDEPVKSILKKD